MGDLDQLTEQELRSVSYEIFIQALSLFSIINIFLLLLPLSQEMKFVILIIDGATTLVFLPDFFHRLRKAPNKKEYMTKGLGWLDLIGSLPFVLFRLARIFRLIRVTREVRNAGQQAIWRSIIRNLATSSVLGVIFLTIVALEYSSLLVLHFEQNARNADIKTASDALWWAYQTVTTVGYGDTTPVTPGGRLVGIVLMTVGVGLFTIFTSYLANAFVSRTRRPTGGTLAGSSPRRVRTGASVVRSSGQKGRSAPAKATPTEQPPNEPNM